MVAKKRVAAKPAAKKSKSFSAKAKDLWNKVKSSLTKKKK